MEPMIQQNSIQEPACSPKSGFVLTDARIFIVQLNMVYIGKFIRRLEININFITLDTL